MSDNQELTQEDLWVAVRDAAASLTPVLQMGALALAQEGSLLDQLWDRAEGDSQPPHEVRGLFPDRAAYRAFIERAAYAGWAWQCPEHGDDADRDGICCPCGCEI